MDTKQQLVNALAGLGSTITEAMDVIEGFVPCGHPALTVSNALVALNADDDVALAQQLETVEGFIDHVSENRGVSAYHGIEVELAGPKADLLAAKKYINFQYYIFSADTIGKELAEILIQKAHEGVKVRVIYDHVGSWSIASSFFKHLREEGVEAYPFLKVTFPQLANRLNWRNHRKVVVIDGEMGYIGGMNIADRYVTGEKGYKAWRDTHLRIVGDAVKGLQFSFAIDWNFMKRMLLDQPCTSTLAPNAETVGMQIVISGPTQPLNAMSMVLLRAISQAQKCIYIQTPYFLPTEGLNSLLQTAALGGIDVQLMLPERSDSRIIDKAVH